MKMTMMMYSSQLIQSGANTLQSKVQLFQPPIHIAPVQEYQREGFITAELSQPLQQGGGIQGDPLDQGDKLKHQHQAQVQTPQIQVWFC